MKKILAVLLCILMTFSLCTVAFASEVKATAVAGEYTSAFLGQIAATKKFYAHVTGHSYYNRTDATNFDIYDDLAKGKVACNFLSKGIKATYDNGQVKCVFSYLFCYLSASVTSAPLLGTAMVAVETFQKVLKNFVDDPKLNNFTKSVTTVERHGQTLTCEKFTGKLLKVSGSFYYDEDGTLCEIQLTDTLGASIAFNVENVSNTFDDSIFVVPFFYIDLSFVWKILSILVGGLF